MGKFIQKLSDGYIRVDFRQVRSLIQIPGLSAIGKYARRRPSQNAKVNAAKTKLSYQA